MIAARHRCPQSELFIPAGANGAIAVPVHVATPHASMNVEGANFLRNDAETIRSLFLDPSADHVTEAFWGALDASATLYPDSPHGRFFRAHPLDIEDVSITFNDSSLRHWARKNVPDTAVDSFLL